MGFMPRHQRRQLRIPLLRTAAQAEEEDADQEAKGQEARAQ
jgi:hypothetical protein